MKKLMIVVFSIVLFSSCNDLKEQSYQSKIPKRISGISSNQEKERVFILEDSISQLTFSSFRYSNQLFGKIQSINDTTIEFISEKAISFGVCKSIKWGKSYLTLYYDKSLKNLQEII